MCAATSYSVVRISFIGLIEQVRTLRTPVLNCLYQMNFEIEVKSKNLTIAAVFDYCMIRNFLQLWEVTEET